mgnify:CR=1 FL=1
MMESRTGAIWWRTSTDDQKEMSPETQVREGRELAEREGYQVPEEYVLGTDWHSLSVWESPPMERLKELIRSHAIHAIFLYDPDRSPSKPAHRLLFRALCEENGVKIRACHGQVPDGDMGEVMEFLSAWHKEKQVYRAQQGARDGLRDRARLRGLPINGRAAYGYRWNGHRFLSDDHYPVAQGIWRMLVEGKTDRGIAAALTRAGVPAPAGGAVWNPSTIAGIATNPVYHGAVRALRWEGVEPKRRRGQTYGKSTCRPRRPEDTITLQGLVEQPIVSQEEFEQVQARRAHNKAYAGQRVRSYLLAGLLVCGLCGRRYSGTGASGRRFPYGYRCTGGAQPVGRPRCRGKLLSGPWLEQQVWHRVREFLENPDLFIAEAGDQQQRSQQTEETIRGTIAGLERQLAQYAGYRQKAYDGLVRGITDEDTYRRVMAGFKAHEAWLQEELARQKRDLESTRQRALDADAIRRLYPLLVERLQGAADADKRFVLDCLGARAVVAPESVTLELAVPQHILQGTVTREPGFPAPS